MKKLVMLGCVVMGTAVATAAVPSGAEWYTPSGGFNPAPQNATWTNGKKTFTCTINTDGSISWGDNRPNDSATCIALENALAAMQETDILQTEIETAPNGLDALRGQEVHIFCGDEMRTVVQPIGNGEPPAVNNRAYCPTAKRMGGGGERPIDYACTAFAVATLAEFDMARRGASVVPVDAEKLHDLARTRTPGRWVQGGARTADVFDAYLDDMGGRAAGIETARYTVVGEGANADNVRQLTKALVVRFGGFVAGVRTTAEWLLLDERLREPREYFGMPADTITGVKVEINCTNGRQLAGGDHSVLVYGYDDAGVLIENVWGTGWGDNGHAKIAWDEWARAFKYGTVMADAGALRDNGIPGCVTIFTAHGCGLGNHWRSGVHTHTGLGLPPVTVSF